MKRVKLITLRKQHKLSQVAVAQYIGISAAAYGRIETGRNLLTDQVMLKLCDCYGCSLEGLLDSPPGNKDPIQAQACAYLKEVSIDKLYRHVIEIQETNERSTAFLVQNMLERCKDLLQEMDTNIPIK